MSLSSFWQKVALIGISEREEFEKREVVLLNKMTFAAIISMVPVIPFEIILNGWALVPYEVIIFVIAGVTFIFNHYKLYAVAKYYFILIATAFIVIMSVVVGPGSGNEFFLIPTFIMPSILFRKKWIAALLSLIILLSFLSISTLQKEFAATIDLPMHLKQQFSYIFYTITFILVFFEIHYFKNINLRFQSLLATKNQEINEKNKEIVDSINYAKRIQDSYLPQKELLHRFFPDSFLFFQPKDIVSGDFYWFYSPHFKDGSEESEVFVAAADCTGHGVPGAIMSVICANALNDVIVTQKVQDTGEILDKVRDHVVKILKEDHSNTKDGMDIVLCKINPMKRTVQYSGAQNPLWVLHSEKDKIDVIKGDKQPIGAYEHATPFTSHHVELTENDQIYFFSDGYQDQFGGDKGKKFKAANMKKLILKYKNEPMSQQGIRLSTEFQKWKGDLEQVDDICIIGIRL